MDDPASRSSPPDTAADRQRPPEPLKSHRRILDEEMGLAQGELARAAHSIIGSGLIAGLSVCVSVFLIAVLDATAGPDLPDVVRSFLVGNAYAAGFLLVIFARADLFTEYTTITLLPVLFRRASVGALGRLWGIVYVANILGALVGAFFLVRLATAHEAYGTAQLGDLAADLVSASTSGLLLGAILAGWLMGLLSWLIVAARETVSQVIFVWVIGITIGFGHLPHSITGTAEVAAGVFAGGAAGAGGLVRFLVLSTLGNALGSVIFAGLVRYAAAGRDAAGGPDADGS